MVKNVTNQDVGGDFSGDECVILPAGYLESPGAVSEIYADELANVAGNMAIDEWSTRGFFHGTVVAALLWVLPSVWAVCY